MRIVRAADHRAMPWKNGGGTTYEIALFPPHADLDGFEWRISLAEVAADGPFSQFEGVERTLTVLEGSGLDLAIDEAPAVRVGPFSPPLTFPADRPTTASLVSGPVTDLNVMTRRGSFRHAVRRIELGVPEQVVSGGDLLVLFCLKGVVDCRLLGGSVRFTVRDAVFLETPEPVLLTPLEPASMVVADLSRTGSS